jgi:hypothetical protein
MVVGGSSIGRLERRWEVSDRQVVVEERTKASPPSKSKSKSKSKFNPEGHRCPRPELCTGHIVVRALTLEVAPETAPDLLPRQPKMAIKVTNNSPGGRSR